MSTNKLHFEPILLQQISTFETAYLILVQKELADKIIKVYSSN